MADVKYGRVYTEADIRKLGEMLFGEQSQSVLAEALRDLEHVGAFTIPANEPTFLIRGKNKAACAAISHYYDVARTVGASDEHLRGVIHSAAEFASWQARNYELVKIPD